MKETQRKILETLGITVAVCIVAAVLIYGMLLIGNDTNPVLGAWLIGIVVFVGVFAGIYLGRN